MAYTDIDKPSDYFNTLLYTGDNSNRSFTGVGFQPDLTWIKARNNTTWHLLYDAVRTAGTGKELHSNSTAAEGASNSSLYGYLSSFDSDGFSTVNGSSSSDALNETGKTYAAWNWKAGGSASSNSNGSITSSVSANTTSGFSIVSYTGNGSAGATIGHGLSQKPSIIITKRRDSISNWLVYSSELGATKYLELETTNAGQTATSRWNDTEPTSSVFSVGTSTSANPSSGTMIAYCFAEKQGYSKFGSYTGNGNADGTFVYTGFKPAWVMAKATTDSGQSWLISDVKRNPFNVADDRLFANLNNAENQPSDSGGIDFLSNGFKIRTNDGSTNASGQTRIYMAFASEPFTTSTGVPATAR